MNTLTHSMQLALQPNDPELASTYGRVSEDIGVAAGLNESTTFVVRLGAMVATGALRQFSLLLEAAHAAGVDAWAFKEVVYQAVPYAGMSKALEALDVLNAFLGKHGMRVTHSGYATVTESDRRAKGLVVQKNIVGADIIEDMYASSPTGLLHIQELLSANCFGDHVA